MATRVYPSLVVPTISPSFSADWLNTTGAVRRSLLSTKDGSTMTSFNIGASFFSSLLVQLVSEPLAANTTFDSGSLTIKGRARYSVVSGNYTPNMIVRIVSNDGATVRGELAFGNGTTGSNTTLTNRNLYGSGSAFYGSVNALAGDRLVIELGFAPSSNNNVTVSLGSDNGTDLPENTTTTTANNPWIEFSNNFTFSSVTPTANHNSLSCMGCG